MVELGSFSAAHVYAKQCTLLLSQKAYNPAVLSVAVKKDKEFGMPKGGNSQFLKLELLG